ncbi:MAG: hypothetical protein MJ252_22680, partial [archaeon]|nr:hypothetical protein [archaeon]
MKFSCKKRERTKEEPTYTLINRKGKLTESQVTELKEQIARELVTTSKVEENIKNERNINEIINSNTNNNFPNIDFNQSESDNSYSKKYSAKYAKYITQIFSTETLALINKICMHSTNIPDNLRQSFPVHNLLIDVTKDLMLNNMELVYLSLFLDTYGWKNDNMNIYENFLVTGLCVKKYLNSDTEIIENYLISKYEGLKDKFKQWVINQNKIKGNVNITPRELNKRYKILNQGYNIFCRKNYIDFNDVVDRILKMSLPYNEGNKKIKKNSKG